MSENIPAYLPVYQPPAGDSDLRYEFGLTSENMVELRIFKRGPQFPGEDSFEENLVMNFLYESLYDFSNFIELFRHTILEKGCVGSGLKLCFTNDQINPPQSQSIHIRVDHQSVCIMEVWDGLNLHKCAMTPDGHPELLPARLKTHIAVLEGIRSEVIRSACSPCIK